MSSASDQQTNDHTWLWALGIIAVTAIVAVVVAIGTGDAFDPDLEDALTPPTEGLIAHPCDVLAGAAVTEGVTGVPTVTVLGGTCRYEMAGGLLTVNVDSAGSDLSAIFEHPDCVVADAGDTRVCIFDRSLSEGLIVEPGQEPTVGTTVVVELNPEQSGRVDLVGREMTAEEIAEVQASLTEALATL